MKLSLIVLAATSALVFPVFAQDAKPTEPHHTAPMMEKMDVDAAHMRAKMNMLLDVRAKDDAAINALQKKLDASDAASEKLKK